MKKITRLVPILLGLSAMNLALVFASSPNAEAKPSTQKQWWEVDPSEWVGTWNCNNDGQQPPVQVKFRLSSGRIYGQIGNDSYALVPRNYDTSIDPRTNRKDHLLPLYSPGNETPWFLALHTWNRTTASGFTRWQGSVYGLTCSLQHR